MEDNHDVHIDWSAPAGIDLAGGALDTWPLHLDHDGETLSAAISLRACCDFHIETDGPRLGRRVSA
jgi:hypothetical protein